MLKEQNEQPASIMLEEFAVLSWPNISKFLGYCRSYLVSVALVIQDASQLIAQCRFWSMLTHRSVSC